MALWNWAEKALLYVVLPVAVGVGVTVGAGALIGLAPLVALGGGIVGGGGLAAFAVSSLGAAASGVASYLLRAWHDDAKPTLAGASVAAGVAVVAGALSLGAGRLVGAALGPTIHRASADLAESIADAPAPVRAWAEALPGVKAPPGKTLQIVANTDELERAIIAHAKRDVPYVGSGDYVSRWDHGVTTGYYELRPSFKWLLAGYENLRDVVLRTQYKQNRIVADAIEAEVKRVGANAVAATAPTTGIAGALGAINEEH